MYTSAKAYSTVLNSHMLKNSEWGAVAYLTDSQYGRNGVEVEENLGYITGNGNIEINTKQSSTGNIYGIYDLSGGASERVASYYNKSESSDLIDYGGSFASFEGSSTKYATAYEGTDVNMNYIVGDATYETKGWNGDSALFIIPEYPFITRSNDDHTGDNAGIFCFNRANGSIENSIEATFRLCLVIK